MTPSFFRWHRIKEASFPDSGGRGVTPEKWTGVLGKYLPCWGVQATRQEIKISPFLSKRDLTVRGDYHLPGQKSPAGACRSTRPVNVVCSEFSVIL